MSTAEQRYKDAVTNYRFGGCHGSSFCDQRLFDMTEALGRVVEESAGEIRMLKMRVAELADEEPATVAAEAHDLHPVALLLAQAYRIAWEEDNTSVTERSMIHDAWCSITGTPRALNNFAIRLYGIPK